MPTGTRGAAKKKAPVKLKTKKSKSSEPQEVLPVDDSSQGSGSVLRFSSGEDTSNGSGSGSGEDTSDEEPKRKQVSAEQAVRKDDDAPTSKQLTLALAMKVHYDSTHKHAVKIDKKSKESISDWISVMMDKGYQPPWDDSKKKSKKSKKH